MTTASERPEPLTATLMEEVVRRENLLVALKKVRANKGAPGIDGMTVEELPGYLKKHWPRIREKLLSGDYVPQPVKRVSLPKPGGGTRELGVPVALDRFIQQAVLQILTPILDPTFSPHSYGFRPGKSAHQAVVQAKKYIAEGCAWVVDCDLEKFLETSSYCTPSHEGLAKSPC
jgi:RNA-directed DNA polymerase